MNKQDKILSVAVISGLFLFCLALLLLCVCSIGCKSVEYRDRIIYEEVEKTVYDQAPPIETPTPPKPIQLTEEDTLKDLLVKVKDYVYDLKRAYLEYRSRVDAHNSALETPLTPFE